MLGLERTKTTDGGNNWFQQELGLDSGYIFGGPLYSVHFIDSNIGWVVGANRFITKTTDGGDTWSRQYFTNETDEPLLKENYVPGEDGIGGNLSVFFKDENIGWIVGGGDYYNVKKTRIVRQLMVGQLGTSIIMGQEPLGYLQSS